jgi:DNA-binding XRE family transcriptional regulator
MLKAEPSLTCYLLHVQGRKVATPVSPPHVDGPAQYETLGARLERLRKVRGLSKTALAHRLGVTPTSICYWEQGRSRPRPALLSAVAEILGLSPADLLGEAPGPDGERLFNMVARMRAEIADAAGVSPAKVRISIEM